MTESEKEFEEWFNKTWGDPDKYFPALTKHDQERRQILEDIKARLMPLWVAEKKIQIAIEELKKCQQALKQIEEVK